MTTLAFNVRSVILSASEGASLHRLHRNSVLFHQGQEQHGLYLIETGLVKVASNIGDGSRLILAVAGPHQLVGEESLVRGARAYQADAVTLTGVDCYQISPTSLKSLMGNSEFAAALVSYFVARQVEMARKLELCSLRGVEYRILAGLADLASLVKPNGSPYPYSIPMTQAEIASYVGATRETTSTVLSNLKRRNLLALARRLVSTVDPDSLVRAANDTLARTTSQ